MCGPGLIAPREPPTPLADGDHCREMAGKVRELARLTHSPGIRRELVDLAKKTPPPEPPKPVYAPGSLEYERQQAEQGE